MGVLVALPRVRRLATRWLKLLALGGRTSARAAAHQARRLSADESRRRELDVEFQIRSAEDVTATLGGMKGAFMKFGQLVSFVDDGMPEHIRAVLSQLQDSAAPMSSELAASVVRAELGDPPEKVFREWDPTPMAAASIGQVHRAVLDDGTAVAVKVQYPGIDKTMEADLAQLDLGRLVIPALWRSLDGDGVVRELRTRLLEELDYELEATNQRDFAAWYSGHPFIRVPAVVDDLSTKRVLTTHLDRGARFSQAEQWDQAERDLAAETIFRFVYRSFFDRLAFNGDPHPGNYLFHRNGIVSFLDFGLVKRLAPEDRDMTVAIAHAAAISPDAKQLRRVLEHAGYYVPDAPISDEVIVRFSDVFWGHFAEDRPLTLTAEWASNTVRRYLVKDAELRDVDRWGAIPPQFIILQRITVGLLAILGRLNATANWRRILLEAWFAGPPATALGQREAEWRQAVGPKRPVRGPDRSGRELGGKVAEEDQMDFIDLFERGTQWTASKIPGALDELDAPTPCDEWNVRALLDHLLASHQYFAAAARDRSAKPPQGTPAALLGDDPVKQYEEAREAMLRTYREPGVIEKTGPSLGIAFVDQLVHGWDLAKATGQDATMPDDLARAAFETVDGRMPDDQRGTFFKPAVAVPEDAPAQDKLLGYAGRRG